MQQLNLDWVLSKLKTLLRLVPDDGAAGQILRRTRDGAVWSDEQGGGGGGAVQSVNGKTGVVVLDAADVGALPDDYTPPVTSVNGQTGAVVIPTGGAVDSVNGQTGTVVLDAADVGALPDDYTPPVTSVNGQTGAVTVSVPVQSVNGKTGAVVLDADDVGALPDDYTPPVTSVNGQTGAVSVCENNNFTVGILLDSYTNSFYTCPQDGYVVASCASQPTSKAICRLYGATSSDADYVQLGGWSNNLYATWAVFARKGMRVKVITIENSGHVLFTPIV